MHAEDELHFTIHLFLIFICICWQRGDKNSFIHSMYHFSTYFGSEQIIDQPRNITDLILPKVDVQGD